MHPSIWALIALAVLVASVVATVIIIRKARARQRRQQIVAARSTAQRIARQQQRDAAKRWMQRVKDTSDPTVLCQLGRERDIGWDDFLAWPDPRDATRKIQEAENVLQARAELAKFDTVEESRLHLLMLKKYAANTFLREAFTTERPNIWVELRALMISQEITPLAAKARQGDADAFSSLHILLKDNYKDRGEYGALGIKLSYPEEWPPDWNDLVSRFVANPDVDDYPGIELWQAPGEVRLLAGRAIAESSPTLAKIALALCNASGTYKSRGQTSGKVPDYRKKELGDELTAKLALIVVDHNTKHGLTV